MFRLNLTSQITFGITIGVCSLIFTLTAPSVEAARFYFAPTSSALSINCPTYTVDVMIDTEGADSNAADIEINYNPADINIVDANPVLSGIQITPGTAYESYRGNITSGNSIKLTGDTAIQNLNGIGKFATIQFSRNPGVTVASFTINFIGVGNSIDSNIAAAITNTDLLDDITNATYNFTNIVCPTLPVVVTDNTPPLITLLAPSNQAANVPVDANIQIQIQDTESNINLASLQFIIDGITYTVASPQVSYTGSGQSYIFTINPTANFDTDKLIGIQVSARDINNNANLQTFQFNSPTQQPDNTAPIITLISPTNGSNDNPANTPIQFRLRDLESGININSLQITINSIVYQFDSPEVTITGNTNEYLVTVIPRDLNPLTPVTVEVLIRDAASNSTLNQFNYNLTAGLPTTPGTPITPQQIITTIIQNPETLIKTIFTTPENPFKGTVLEGTIIERFTEATGTAGAGNLLVTGLLLFNLLSFVNLLTAPALLSSLLGLLFRKKRDKTWGTIFDGQTNKPVSFAIVRIYISGTKSMIEQKVSDLQGHYGFLLSPGNYRLEITHQNYRQATQEVTIVENEPNYNLDIRLIPSYLEETASKATFLQTAFARYKKFMNRLTPFLFLTGFLLSLISFTLYRTPINLGLLILYTVLLIALILSVFRRRGRTAAVVDSKTGLRIPGAMVRIYNPETYELVESQPTNLTGRFNFWVEPGAYAIIVSARGYKFPSEKQTNYPIINNKYSAMLKVEFGKKKDVTLMVDPVLNLSDTAMLMSGLDTQNIKPNNPTLVFDQITPNPFG